MTIVEWWKVPIIGCPGAPVCCIPTTSDGRSLDDAGEPLPMEQRTMVCGADTVWIVGEATLCRKHAAEVATLMGDSLEEIERAWRDSL